MKISDEMLSAFLDAELPETEMEFVRQCISEDETLANRLAELAMVDEQVAQHYKSIDTRPLPTVITQLLESAPAIASTAATPFPTTSASATIIAFPLWKSIQRGIQQHAAIAACTLLVLGFGLAQLLPNKNDSLMGDWSAIASALDTTTSGTTQSLTDGKQIKPRLTFVDQQGNYCRQFLVSDSHTASENIACRINDEWRPNATIYSHDVQHANEYETATNDTEMLDNTLDLMMSGDAFDAQEESRIIRDGWKK